MVGDCGIAASLSSAIPDESNYTSNTGNSGTSNLPRHPKWHFPAKEIPVAKPDTTVTINPSLCGGTRCWPAQEIFFFISDTFGAGGAGTGNEFTVTDEDTGTVFKWTEGDASFDIPVANKDGDDGAVTFALVGSSHGYASPVGFMKAKSCTQSNFRIRLQETRNNDGSDVNYGYFFVANWLDN